MTRSLRRTLALLAPLFAAALMPLTASGENDPYQITRDRFRATVRAIGIEPIVIGPGAAANEGLASRIEAGVRSHVEAKGFRVVGSDDWEVRWRAASEPLGGAWNSASGEMDAERARVIREATLRALALEQGVDATLHVATARRDVATYSSFEHRLAAGDRGLTWDGEPWNAPASQRPQSVEATYLDVQIRDPAGAVLYAAGCPIRWVAIYAARTFQEIDEAEFYPAESVERALTECLDDLSGDEPGARER